jgi:hemolysin III
MSGWICSGRCESPINGDGDDGARLGLKQPFNAISHMVGGGLSFAATPILLGLARGPLAIVMVGLYAFGLVSLYTLSTLFHAIRATPRGELWLERLDHVGIYLLIAGTYSPVALILLEGTIGWVLFLIAWSVAITGIVVALTLPLGPKWVHITGYIALGWAAVIAAPALLERLDWLGFVWLLGGGILYSGGGFLYVRDRPRLIGPFGDHEVWHVIVLGASAMHYVFILRYVL